MEKAGLPLLFLHSKDTEKTMKSDVFSSIKDGSDKYVIIQSPPQFHGKQIQAYTNGWFILLQNNNYIPEKTRELLGHCQNFAFGGLSTWAMSRKRLSVLDFCIYAAGLALVCKLSRALNQPEQTNNPYRYFLWNPLTSEYIPLPLLTLERDQEIKGCMLYSSPDKPDCMLILYDRKLPSLIFNRVGIGEKLWSHQCMEARFRDDYLTNFVFRDGSFYSPSFSVNIDHHNNSSLVVNSLDDKGISISLFQDNLSTRASSYMLESCGELFVVYLIKGGVDQVISVEIFKLDFSSMVWKKTENIKDRAFFLSNVSCFSCPSSELKIKCNHVYFTLPKDESLYSFNMNDQTISVSLPCPETISWYSPFWIMPDLSLDELSTKRKQEIIKPAKCKDHQIVKFYTEGDFGKLPLEILFSIGEFLMPHDYMSFRTVNKRFRMAAPPVPWTKEALKCLEQSYTLPPWLMCWKKGSTVCYLIDLWGENYPMKIPNNEAKDVRLSYSRSGWCLMLKGKRSVFLWNPSVNKIIRLPDMIDHESREISCFSFSSYLNRVVLMGVSRGFSFIDHIIVDGGVWRSENKNFTTCCIFSNISTFWEGTFYNLDTEGKLFAYKQGTGLIKCLQSPPELPHSSFYQRFLVSCGMKLLSVFVGSMGKWVQIFWLHRTGWKNVESLGNVTLFVSHYSSFATAANRGMENRVYFSRFYGNNAVYYSLDSKKLHSHSTGEVLESFYDTEEHLHSCWIRPTWDV